MQCARYTYTKSFNISVNLLYKMQTKREAKREEAALYSDIGIAKVWMTSYKGNMYLFSIRIGENVYREDYVPEEH
jgi:hypothetical protein